LVLTFGVLCVNTLVKRHATLLL